MKLKTTVLAALVGLSASPVAAQSRWQHGPAYYEGLSTRTIMRIVRAEGLRPVGGVALRGRRYIVRAIDDFGDAHRVVIDARTGRILRIRAARRSPRRWDDYFDDPPRPPRALARRSDPSRDYDVAPLPPPPPHNPFAPPPAQSERRGPPASPPVPRPRPSQTAKVAPETPPPAETSGSAPAKGESKPAAEPATPRPLPRVVLPGGPLPKAQRTAETRPGQPIAEPEKPAADKPDPEKTEAAPASRMPPVQPLE